MSDYTNTGKKAYPPRGKMLTIPEGGKAGQMLVKTANGVEWADPPKSAAMLVGNITEKTVEGEIVYSCDKTYAELKAAWDEGRDVAVKYDGIIARLAEDFVATPGMLMGARNTQLVFDTNGSDNTLGFRSHITQSGEVDIEYKE